MAVSASHQKKQAVFREAPEQAGPIALKDLLVLLDKGYAERSVRRWLAEMAEKALVERVGQKRSSLYSAAARGSCIAVGRKRPRVVDEIRVRYRNRPHPHRLTV